MTAETRADSPRPPDSAATPAAAPILRLEVRLGLGRPAVHDVQETGFLIGTVPGCDLRLPGADLPPLLCLLVPHGQGLLLRKLTATAPVSVEGQLRPNSILVHGDKLSVGPAQIVVLQTAGAHPPQPLPAPKKNKAAEDTRGVIEEGGEGDLRAREEQLLIERQELMYVRAELLAIREELHARYQHKRQRLTKLHDGIRRAATKLQERKQLLDAHARELDEQTALQSKDSPRAADLAEREAALARREAELAGQQAQYQTDLVRLDRLQATVEQRQEQLKERILTLDQDREELQKTGRELEEQAQQLSELHDQLRRHQTALSEQKQEQAAARTALAQRTAQVEGQQTMLSTLRSRLERMRDELQAEQQHLHERQASIEAREQDLKEREEKTAQLEAELEADRLSRASERKLLEERQAALEAAVTQVRGVEERVAARESELAQRQEELDRLSQQRQREDAELGQKATQLLELQNRITADRQVLREREEKQLELELAREALQEQLRRRSEDLTARQRTLAEQARQQAEVADAIASRQAEVDEARRQLELERTGMTDQGVARSQEFELRAGELALREHRWQVAGERLRETGRKLGARRKALRLEAGKVRAEQEAAQKALADAQLALTESQHAFEIRTAQLPDLEQQAQAALERLTHARQQLKEHLDELNAYARASREDVDAWRAQVQEQAHEVQEQFRTLDRARDEHRHAVAAFRQQVIAWQGQMEDLKRTLAHGETRLERRQAAVELQVRNVDEASQRLAQQAEELAEQEREVARDRQEVMGQLEDMRAWYRRKIRELSQSRMEAAGTNKAPTRELLAVTGQPDAGDRKLGDLLLSLNLVDDDTLTALLVEACQQRRTLRQVLLSGGYLSIYQMALIETGQVEGLVLGPLRVIDRLRVTPREAVYRVYDPRRGRDAMVRHLAEAEMENAVRPDEFRQRFAQAVAIQSPHVVAVLEVLDIAGRPAVEQEMPSGLPASEWPALASIPGVWYRLLCQAVIGLQTAHQAQLCFGTLTQASFLLSGEGTLKLSGLGEPPWLTGDSAAEPSVAADLAALGQCAREWSELAGPRRANTSRPFPEALIAILDRMTTDEPARVYTDVASLLADLDKAGPLLPANAEAWDRLLHYVRDNVGEPVALRRSA